MYTATYLIKKRITILLLPFTLLGMVACSGSRQTEDQKETSPTVSVRVVTPAQGLITSYITVIGKTVYLKKNSVMAPFSGYVTAVNVRLGDRIQKNQPLFVLETKEERALAGSAGMSANNGKIRVLSPLSGFISDLSVTSPGGYVTEGSVLGTVAESQQVTIQVNMPYEYHSLVALHTGCLVKLSDHTTIKGTVARILPTVDPVSQTQTVFIQPLANKPLPENLNVVIQFMNQQHNRTLLLPKTAILTNETQDLFWVMKVVHNNLAVKVPIVTGIANDSTVEILSPSFSLSDPIVTEGAYGLSDSTVVKIIR